MGQPEGLGVLMCRTKGALPVSQLEIEAAIRLLTEDEMTWRDAARILRRSDHSTLRRAVKRHILRQEAANG